VLALNPRPFGNQGRRDDVARVALAHHAVDHVAGAAGLVAGAKLTLHRRVIKPALQFDEIVRQAVNAIRGLRIGRERCDRNRLLAHIHPEIDDCASGRNNGS